MQVRALIMGYKFSGTVLIQTIFAATEQKREHHQQQQQRVSAVRYPDGLFMISTSTVLLFCPLSANLQFHFLITLIFKQPTHQQHKK